MRRGRADHVYTSERRVYTSEEELRIYIRATRLDGRYLPETGASNRGKNRINKAAECFRWEYVKRGHRILILRDLADCTHWEMQ